jgi:hypothetical protein
LEHRRQLAAVLARQRVVGTEFGEDRHNHRAAQQIAALGVLLGGEGLLKAQGPAQRRECPRRERPLELRGGAVAGQLVAGRKAFRNEVAADVPQSSRDHEGEGIERPRPSESRARSPCPPTRPSRRRSSRQEPSSIAPSDWLGPTVASLTGVSAPAQFTPTATVREPAMTAPLTPKSLKVVGVVSGI